jgi:hypothetical protein
MAGSLTRPDGVGGGRDAAADELFAGGTSLVHLTATQIAHRVAIRNMSAAEVVDAHLARIDGDSSRS